jgi:hypothetical protein
MLEHRVLLVQTRTASARQPIVDGEGLPLGFVHWSRSGSRSWWRLFGDCVLEVHEQEDESLLFTLHRAWSFLPRCEVRDADGQPVGSVLGRLIQDRFGRTLAAFQEGVFRNPTQLVLAELTPTADGLRLAFRDDIAGEPFLKMLLLAAALKMAR